MSVVAYYFWLIFFGAVIYMMIVDKNVTEFVYLFAQGVVIQLRKYYLLVRLHPFWITNPVGKWWMMRKYRKMAEEMMLRVKENNEEG